MSRWYRLSAVAVVAACLASCAGPREEPGVSTAPGAPDSNATTSSSASAPPPASSPPPSPPPPFDLDDQRRATAAYPERTDLPRGWEQVDPTTELPEYPGDPVYCGVPLEPTTASGSALHLYRGGDAGPYVLQYTFVLGEQVAAGVLGELGPAVADCIRAGRDDVGRVFAAREAPTVGEESVSMAFVADAGAVSQVTVFRRTDVIVALVGFDPAGLPPLAEIGSIAQSVDAGLTAP